MLSDRCGVTILANSAISRGSGRFGTSRMRSVALIGLARRIACAKFTAAPGAVRELRLLERETTLPARAVLRAGAALRRRPTDAAAQRRGPDLPRPDRARGARLVRRSRARAECLPGAGGVRARRRMPWRLRRR